MTEHPLKTLREARELTQVDLAALAGVSQPSVSRIEAGGHLYRGTALLKVAQALNVGATKIPQR